MAESIVHGLAMFQQVTNTFPSHNNIVNRNSGEYFKVSFLVLWFILSPALVNQVICILRDVIFRNIQSCLHMKILYIHWRLETFINNSSYTVESKKFKCPLFLDESQCKDLSPPLEKESKSSNAGKIFSFQPKKINIGKLKLNYLKIKHWIFGNICLQVQ